MIKTTKPDDWYRYLLMAFHLLDYVDADGRHRLHDQIGGCTQGDWRNLWITDEFSSTIWEMRLKHRIRASTPPVVTRRKHTWETTPGFWRNA